MYINIFTDNHSIILHNKSYTKPFSIVKGKKIRK